MQQEACELRRGRCEGRVSKDGVAASLDSCCKIAPRQPPYQLQCWSRATLDAHCAPTSATMRRMDVLVFDPLPACSFLIAISIKRKRTPFGCTAEDPPAMLCSHCLIHTVTTQPASKTGHAASLDSYCEWDSHDTACKYRWSCCIAGFLL